MQSATKSAVYWIATVILSLELLVGGVADILRAQWATAIMVHLGYPLYMMLIIGTWKVLGAVAIAVPLTTTAREWAYAGVFFEITGALASHLLNHDPLSTIGSPIAFTLITLLSWRLWKDRADLRTSV
jgi:uncharacterized membrane protein